MCKHEFETGVIVVTSFEHSRVSSPLKTGREKHAYQNNMMKYLFKEEVTQESVAQYASKEKDLQPNVLQSTLERYRKECLYTAPLPSPGSCSPTFATHSLHNVISALHHSHIAALNPVIITSNQAIPCNLV